MVGLLTVSPDHNLFGNTFQISAVLDTFSQYFPLVKINNDKIYSLWFEGEKTKANIIDFNSPPVTIFINENSNKINKCYLSDNYPNPFNSVSMIEFKVSKQSNVRLVVFDNLGRKINTIFDQPVDPRKLYRVTWDGKNSHGIDVSSGVYYYKLISDSYTKTKKLVLVR